MAESVISHHKPRRKRASAWVWTARRVLAFALTLAAIAAATWVVPYLQPATPRFPDTQAPPVLAAPELPEPVAIIEPLAGPPPAVRPQARHRGIPLNADAAGPGEDFEVLSASELDRISQALEE